MYRIRNHPVPQFPRSLEISYISFLVKIRSTEVSLREHGFTNFEGSFHERFEEGMCSTVHLMKNKFIYL